jgi:hypothetical protein
MLRGHTSGLVVLSAGGWGGSEFLVRIGRSSRHLIAAEFIVISPYQVSIVIDTIFHTKGQWDKPGCGDFNATFK